MKEFYYHDGKDEFGPFTLEQLKNQSITKDNLVWFHPMKEWKAAGEIKEIKSLFTDYNTLDFLKSNEFRNSDLLTEVNSNKEWVKFANNGLPAFCKSSSDIGVYSSDDNKKITSHLFNWHTIVDKRNICPIGYHLFSDEEWTEMCNEIGLDEILRILGVDNSIDSFQVWAPSKNNNETIIRHVDVRNKEISRDSNLYEGNAVAICIIKDS